MLWPLMPQLISAPPGRKQSLTFEYTGFLVLLSGSVELSEEVVSRTKTP